MHPTTESVTRKLDRINVGYKISASIAKETFKIFKDKTESEVPLV